MIKAPVPAALLALTTLVVAMSVSVHPVAASSARSGQLHLQKDCSAFAKNGFPYCTITSSSLAEIPLGDVSNPGAGSLVVYDQPADNWVGMLDSNVVLFIGPDTWAAGRCTFHGATGLCTFSDGVGQLAGFTARVDVRYAPTASNPYLYVLDGTYTFNPLPVK